MNYNERLACCKLALQLSGQNVYRLFQGLNWILVYSFSLLPMCTIFPCIIPSCAIDSSTKNYDARIRPPVCIKNTTYVHKQSQASTHGLLVMTNHLQESMFYDWDAQAGVTGWFWILCRCFLPWLVSQASRVCHLTNLFSIDLKICMTLKSTRSTQALPGQCPTWFSDYLS